MRGILVAAALLAGPAQAGVERDLAFINRTLGWECSITPTIVIASRDEINAIAVGLGYSPASGLGLADKLTNTVYLAPEAGPHVRVHELAHICGAYEAVADQVHETWLRLHPRGR